MKQHIFVGFFWSLCQKFSLWVFSPWDVEQERKHFFFSLCNLWTQSTGNAAAYNWSVPVLCLNLLTWNFICSKTFSKDFLKLFFIILLSFFVFFNPRVPRENPHMHPQREHAGFLTSTEWSYMFTSEVVLADQWGPKTLI